MPPVGLEARVACVGHDLTQVGECGLDRRDVVNIVCFLLFVFSCVLCTVFNKFLE